MTRAAASMAWVTCICLLAEPSWRSIRFLVSHEPELGTTVAYKVHCPLRFCNTQACALLVLWQYSKISKCSEIGRSGRDAAHSEIL